MFNTLIIVLYQITLWNQSERGLLIVMNQQSSVYRRKSTITAWCINKCLFAHRRIISNCPDLCENAIYNDTFPLHLFSHFSGEVKFVFPDKIDTEIKALFRQTLTNSEKNHDNKILLKQTFNTQFYGFSLFVTHICSHPLIS